MVLFGGTFDGASTLIRETSRLFFTTVATAVAVVAVVVAVTVVVVVPCVLFSPRLLQQEQQRFVPFPARFCPPTTPSNTARTARTAQDSFALPALRLFHAFRINIQIQGILPPGVRCQVQLFLEPQHGLRPGTRRTWCAVAQTCHARWGVPTFHVVVEFQHDFFRFRQIQPHWFFRPTNGFVPCTTTMVTMVTMVGGVEGRKGGRRGQGTRHPQRPMRGSMRGSMGGGGHVHQLPVVPDQ